MEIKLKQSHAKASSLRGKRRVLVAMSGGVDSSVAAALLKKEGHEVAGVFMKFWSGEGLGPELAEGSCPESVEGCRRSNRCCDLESERRAWLVASKLDIPFYVVNFEKEFKEKIVDSFLEELKAGRTPNPCVSCNKEIKFNLLFNKFSLGENEFLATGHYVRFKNQKLLKAEDPIKDQTYFLWKLNKKIFEKTLFPVGDYKKEEVRKIAKKFNLPTAETPESQEVCFVTRKIEEFLKENLGVNKGRIIDTEGKILGEHEGLWFYTLGQRKGMGLSGGPYYVIKKDLENNALVVTSNEKDLLSKDLFFKESNWILGKEPKFPLEVFAKIRSAHEPAKAIILTKDHLVFDKPQKAVTPGQSVVFYNKEEVLGGGIISR